MQEALRYLKQEKGLRSIYSYMAFTNGVGNGYAPLLVAFFSTAPGMSATMYSLFSAAEFIGRSLGGVFCYKVPIKPKKRFSFAFLVFGFTVDFFIDWPFMLLYFI